MKRIVQLVCVYFLTAYISAYAGTLPPQLDRADINELTDKNFYLTEVNVIVTSSKSGYQSSVGIDNPVLQNNILTALPVENIIKIIASDYNIKIDSSDFKKADLQSSGNSWKSNHNDANSITISYKIHETAGSGFEFLSSYFSASCNITIKSAAGVSKNISIQFPEPQKRKIVMYYPFNVAKKTGLKPDEVTKKIIMEDITKISGRLQKELKRDKLTPIRVK